MIAILMACPWEVRADRDAARAQASASGSASVEPAPAEIAAGTRMHAVLESKLDVRLLEVGDRVEARTSRAVLSGERVVLPRGSKLLGRIRSVEAGEAGARSESRLSVSFDRAVLPDGQEIAVDLAIQAIAAAGSELESTPSVRGSALGTSRAARSSEGLFGGALGGIVGDAPELDERIASDVAIGADASLDHALDADGTLSSSSTGVIGLRGVQLDASGKSSLILRSDGPITLPSGTRLLLRAKGAVRAH